MIFQLTIGVTPDQINEPSASPSSGGTIATYVIIGVLVLMVLGILIQKLLRVLRRPEMHGMTREKVLSTWQEIEKSCDQGVMGAKVALMEADKLLDGVMKSLYLPGDTMGERLKAARYKYPKIDKVWGAHRLRNQLVHDAAFQITVRQAKSALADYAAALKVLNIM